jgi:fructose-bisphosphate aldolase class I
LQTLARPPDASRLADASSAVARTRSAARACLAQIMFEETLAQRCDDGRLFVDALREAGVIPGIKVDTGVSPLPHGGAAGETWTTGLDGLAARCALFREAGARFAKWRAVLRIDPAGGAPSELALREAARGLAFYAATCQAAGLVPIMEPEVLADGAHDAHACAAATERALGALFAACASHGVRLEGALLKPNMVTPGDGAPGGRPPPADVAAATLRVLRRTVPPALPGVLFLSGGQPERVASANLDAMARAPGPKPWALSFSYGRALQASALAAWRGQEANVGAAQAVFAARCAANGAAAMGQYDAAADV